MAEFPGAFLFILLMASVFVLFHFENSFLLLGSHWHSKAQMVHVLKLIFFSQIGLNFIMEAWFQQSGLVGRDNLVCLGEVQTKLAANEYNKHSHTVYLQTCQQVSIWITHNPKQMLPSKIHYRLIWVKWETLREGHTHSSRTDEFKRRKRNHKAREMTWGLKVLVVCVCVVSRWNALH